MLPMLDVHDDHGALLREAVSFDDLPDFIKVASFADRGTMPPDDFALILMDADGTYPRFPRNDAGNTAISTRYLTENFNELSKEAAATAAHNLAVACREQGLPIPDALLKLAGICGKEDVREKVPYIEVHKGLRLLAGEPKRESVLKDRKAHAVKKDEVSQHGGPATKLKTSSSSRLFDRLTRLGTKGRRADEALTTEAEKKKKAKEKAAQSSVPYSHTKKAADHFNENWKRMDPRERVKLAQAIVPSCRALGIELVKEAYDYAEGVKDMGRVTVCTRVRKWYTADERYDQLEKIAGSMEAPELIETLWELDTDNGITGLWSGKVPDPFLSVLEKQASDPERFIAGNEYTTAADLEELARNRPDLIKEQFSDAFAAQFLKSPVTVFKSLPLTTKTLLIRMSRDNTGSTKE